MLRRESGKRKDRPLPWVTRRGELERGTGKTAERKGGRTERVSRATPREMEGPSPPTSQRERREKNRSLLQADAEKDRWPPWGGEKGGGSRENELGNVLPGFEGLSRKEKGKEGADAVFRGNQQILRSQEFRSDLLPSG